MVRVIMHTKEGGVNEGFVDIRNKTCSCSVFQVDQFVCGRCRERDHNRETSKNPLPANLH